MKPDGTSSFSTADEKLVSPEGSHVTEPDVKTGSAIKKYRHSDGTTWSYIFVHNSKVKKLEMLLEEDGRTYFVHKTVRYFRKQGKHKVRHQEVPTVSQRHHLIASVSCSILTIIMLATASSSVSPQVSWQDWKVTSSVSTETAAW